MEIIHVASECAPFAKAGGLGEVVSGLSRSLVERGHQVKILLPFYDQIDRSKLKNLKKRGVFWEASFETLSLILFEQPSFFERGKIYGYEDDITRFLFFSKMAFDFLLQEEGVDVLHLHDWHPAILAPLLRDRIKKVVLSLHNVEYQGKCRKEDLSLFGPLPMEAMRDPQDPNLLNLLKTGVVFSDASIAVSPTYAHEILTQEIGFGLDGVFREHKKKIFGILNGMDLSIPPFSKGKAKEVLARRFSLDLGRAPWAGSICRLTEQKGPELLEAALRYTVEKGGTFLLLGSLSDPSIQGRFETLKKEFSSPEAMIHFDFDETLSHQIYAALDFFLMPSYYEPCGLAQLIAMKYGALPIVRSTGGLKDTVFDGKNGFVFEKISVEELKKTLERSFHLFKENPKKIASMIHYGQGLDFGWKKPTLEYERLYLRSPGLPA